MAGADHGVPEQWGIGKDVVSRARDKRYNLGTVHKLISHLDGIMV